MEQVDVLFLFGQEAPDEVCDVRRVVHLGLGSDGGLSGCGDACPTFPGKNYQDWDVADPAGQDIEQVRVIRDDIERRVRRLLDQLHIAAT